MFLSKITGKYVKPEIYLMSYFWTLLTLVNNQGIFVYNQDFESSDVTTYHKFA